MEERQRRQVASLRAERSAEKASTALRRLKEGAEGDANLMPLIIDCARAYVTEGEIVATLKEVFGLYKEVSLF